mgnify:CR=1 FL=1|tara:strand:+ start:441 stop:641 length:201 start_codon:yes stop_codon:yes gene_type:complete
MIPKSTGPGALTRKEFGYTAPSHEQLMEELEYITLEMGGQMEKTITLNSSGRSSKKIIIEYNVEEK